MASQAFFSCTSCKNIFLLEKDNANFCPFCGQPTLSEITGRFILRCPNCGKTQEKKVFQKLHGNQALRCQNPGCGGPIKVIYINKRPRKKGDKNKDVPKPPPVPSRRKLTPRVERGRILSRKLTTEEIKDYNIQQQTESISEQPESTIITGENLTPDRLRSLKPREKDHASLRPGDFLKFNDEWYVIEKKLGTGGMGAVWKGWSLKTGKPVAIKEFYYTRYHDSETGENHCERYWKREARITKIQMDSAEPSMGFIGALKIDKFKIPEYYILLEFIEGEPLDEWYTKRYRTLADLTVKELRMIIRDILQPIARHMYYVHQKGIIHRDLTVQNIIIQTLGPDRFRPIIIDWGVAKERPKEKLYNPRKPYYVSSTPEATGIKNRGTPPEVMAGFEPIAATDIYMLGHIMFYLFSGGNYAGTAATIEDYVLHPIDYNPNLPPGFNEIVEYMTQYEPADRMPNMIKVHEALQWLYDSTANLENPQIERPRYYLYCDWNEAYIEIPPGEIVKIGRDEIIAHGTNHSMDGHLYNALVPLDGEKYQFALYLEDDTLYVRDFYSKEGTYISNLTSINRQVYNNIQIKGLDNVAIPLSEANLGRTTLEVVYNAPDGKVYRIPFKIVKK